MAEPGIRNVAPPDPPRPQTRGRFDAVVEVNRAVCREHFLLRLRVPGGLPPTRPGQFVQVGCRAPNGAIDAQSLCGEEYDVGSGSGVGGQGPGVGAELREALALLRRPFSLAGRGDDAGGSWVEIVHRVVGVGTRWLSNLCAGDRVDLIGPLGNWFDLPAGKTRALLVGGGVGLPPMFYLGEALHAAKWDAIAFVGAMSRDLLAVTLSDSPAPDTDGRPRLSVAEFARHAFPAVVTTNDGSCGLKGFITTGLEQTLSDQTRAQAARTVIYTCGPEAMMHAVAKLAAAHRVDCQVCMEQAMACGMGTCQSCVVKIDPRTLVDHAAEPQGVTPEGRAWRYKLACTDGPVFDAKMVVW